MRLLSLPWRVSDAVALVVIGVTVGFAARGAISRSGPAHQSPTVECRAASAGDEPSGLSPLEHAPCADPSCHVAPHEASLKALGDPVGHQAPDAASLNAVAMLTTMVVVLLGIGIDRLRESVRFGEYATMIGLTLGIIIIAAFSERQAQQLSRPPTVLIWTPRIALLLILILAHLGGALYGPSSAFQRSFLLLTIVAAIAWPSVRFIITLTALSDANISRLELSSATANHALMDLIGTVLSVMIFGPWVWGGLDWLLQGQHSTVDSLKGSVFILVVFFAAAATTIDHPHIQLRWIATLFAVAAFNFVLMTLIDFEIDTLLRFAFWTLLGALLTGWITTRQLCARTLEAQRNRAVRDAAIALPTVSGGLV